MKTGGKYGKKLPSLKTEDTALFRFAKNNNQKWIPPQNGVDLMMLIIALLWLMANNQKNQHLQILLKHGYINPLVSKINPPIIRTPADILMLY